MAGSTVPGIELQDADRALLDALQAEFPLIERPYRTIGQGVGMSGAEVMDRVLALREGGIIRQISGIFDTRKLGYKSTLVAAKLPEDCVEAGAAVVSRHPGVSHNYLRSHAYNLWFTLAVPPGGDLEAELARMAREAGFEAFRVLPSTRVFRIGVQLAMSGHRPGRHGAHGAERGGESLPPLTEQDKAVIRELQEDFPVVERPYAPMARRLGVSETTLFERAKAMVAQGRLRRVSAVLRHRRAGFTANGMVVWNAPEDRVEAMGRFCAEIPEISHCYQRPTYPDWPYSLFTMIHARDRSGCEAVVRRVLDAFGDVEYQVLYSTREFKKERVRYFVEDGCGR